MCSPRWGARPRARFRSHRMKRPARIGHGAADLRVLDRRASSCAAGSAGCRSSLRRRGTSPHEMPYDCARWKHFLAVAGGDQAADRVADRRCPCGTRPCGRLVRYFGSFSSPVTPFSSIHSIELLPYPRRRSSGITAIMYLPSAVGNLQRRLAPRSRMHARLAIDRRAVVHPLRHRGLGADRASVVDRDVDVLAFAGRHAVEEREVMPWSAKAQPMCHAWCPCPPIGVAFGSE